MLVSHGNCKAKRGGRSKLEIWRQHVPHCSLNLAIIHGWAQHYDAASNWWKCTRNRNNTLKRVITVSTGKVPEASSQRRTHPDPTFPFTTSLVVALLPRLVFLAPVSGSKVSFFLFAQSTEIELWLLLNVSLHLLKTCVSEPRNELLVTRMNKRILN